MSCASPKRATLLSSARGPRSPTGQTQGSPYLWWLNADQATILQAVVNWGLSANLIGFGTKVGVIAGSRASDQAALNDYLLPDLAAAGVTPIVKTIDADPDDTASTDAEAPLVIQQLRSDGVTSVIPLIPFNVFFPVLQAETNQQYFPRLLLSDYESSITSSLGLMPVPYSKALNGQEGVTTETLGGIDSPRPESQGGYDSGLRTCWDLWHQTYPETPPGNINDYVEEQGPIAGWCQAIALFTTAAKNAGPDLNRRTFRNRDVEDPELSRDLGSSPQLWPRQALRPNPVPGGRIAHQLSPVFVVQVDSGHSPSGHLLGERRTVATLALRLIGVVVAGKLRGRASASEVAHD